MTYVFIGPRQTIGTLFALFCGISHKKIMVLYHFIKFEQFVTIFM